MKLKTLIENDQQVSERPMNFIQKGINKLGAKVLPGSFGAKMQGKLDTGNVANQLYKDYFTYLGRIRQDASTENLLSFLKSKGVDREIDVNKAIGGIQEAVLSRGQLGKIFTKVAAALAGAPQGSSEQPASGTAPAQQAQEPAAASSQSSAEPAAPQQAAPQAQQPAQGGFGQTVKTAIGKAWNATKNAVQQPDAPQQTAPQAQQPAAPQQTQQPAQSGIQLDPGSQGGFKKSIAPQQAKQQPDWAKKRAQKWNNIAMAKKGIHTITPPGTKINEEILAKITEAAYTGKPITRELYAAAIKMLRENNTTFKEIGIRVLLRESTKNTVKLQKI
jgi:Flp pilus assembly pilin Flp